MLTTTQSNLQYDGDPGMSLTDFALLTDLLANLYADAADARRVLTSASVPVIDIDLSGSPRRMWWNFMGLAIHQLNHMVNVVKFAANEFQNHSSLTIYLKKIEFELLSAKGDSTLSPPPDSQKSIWLSIKKLFKKDPAGDIISKPPSYTVPAETRFWKSFEEFENFLSLPDALALGSFKGKHLNAVCLPNGFVILPYLNDSFFDTGSSVKLVLPPQSNNAFFNKVNISLDPSFQKNNQQLGYTILKRIHDSAHAQVKMDISVEKPTTGMSIQIIGYEYPSELFIQESIISEIADETFKFPFSKEAIMQGAAVLHNKKLIGIISVTEHTMHSSHATAICIQDIILDASLEF